MKLNFTKLLLNFVMLYNHSYICQREKYAVIQLGLFTALFMVTAKDDQKMSSAKGLRDRI